MILIETSHSKLFLDINLDTYLQIFEWRLDRTESVEDPFYGKIKQAILGGVYKYS